MKAGDRFDRIVTFVAEKGRANVEDLAEMLGISRETVRRDLTKLSEKGLLRKVHGGALPQQTAEETPFDSRLATNRSEKMSIASAAAALFQPGDSLFVDAGSTTVHFAEALAALGRFTIITNSPLVAMSVSRPRGGSDVYLLGGRFDGETTETVGPVVLEQSHMLRADHAVITIGGMDFDGTCSDYNADEAYIARAMIERSKAVTVLADHSKLGRSALFQVCEARQIQRLVTDLLPPQRIVDALANAGTQLIIAVARTK
jgi:DeoR family glycerol-3-phosphate regulon repressor